jgi:hypothetical protein
VKEYTRHSAGIEGSLPRAVIHRLLAKKGDSSTAAADEIEPHYISSPYDYSRQSYPF